MRLMRTWGVPTAGLLAVAATAGAFALPAVPATAGTRMAARAASIANGELFGVAGTSASNAWAVGQAIDSGKTITMHWNGTAWNQVPSPTPAGGTALYAVAATSANDVWAVGGSDGPPDKTEILHWNGVTWQQVPSPTPAGGGSLFGVTATSASNAWAVGCTGNCFQDLSSVKTLILHWDGSTWKQVPSPSPAAGTVLSSVAATSASNAWAVGCTAFCFLSSASPQTVLLHWDGTAWKQQPSPASAQVGALNGVAATSASNAWAVGCTGHCFGPMATTQTMILRWDGTAWQQVPSPSPAGNSVLTAVAATSTSNAWAVGYTRNSDKTLIVRWNGTTWKQVPSPTPGQISELRAVAATSNVNAWTVGDDLSGTISLHWDGTAWK